MEMDGVAKFPVHTFPETDYRFGVGPLRMSVERIDWSNPVLYDGETWYEIAGVEQTADGRAMSPRRALVKESQLPRAWRNIRS